MSESCDGLADESSHDGEVEVYSPEMHSVADEDLLYPSGSAHWHLTSQAMRYPGDVEMDVRHRIEKRLEAGDLEPVPIQVTARNRQGDVVRVLSEWDGVQLHLDIHRTRAPELPLRSALRAVARHYGNRFPDPKLVVLVLLVLAIVLALLAGALGVI